VRRFIPVLLVCGILTPAVAQQMAGTASFNEQQIAAIFAGIAKHAERLQPMLGQLHPAEWVAKGAPDTYVTQHARSLAELRGIQDDMAYLTEHPGTQVTETIKALFRVQAEHQLLGSLMGGLRKYQNPALADLIEAVAAEDQADVARLQQYLLELIADRDAQFKVVDGEAQRCRANLARQTSCPPSTSARPSAARPAQN